MPGIAPGSHSNTCSNPDATAGCGQISKHNRRTTDKNLRTIDWRRACSVLREYRSYSLFYFTKKKY
jgi:hypothetical protein